MNRKPTQVMEQLLDTAYSPWRNRLSTAVLVLLTTGMVSGWWYAYYTVDGMRCHDGLLYSSAVWLLIQWVVLGYLYRYQNIPRFAREAIKLLILISNVWFGLLVFSLQTCSP